MQPGAFSPGLLENDTIPILDTDTGSGLDTENLVAAISESDLGSGVDIESLIASILDPDTGTGVETESLTATLSDADTGSGVEVESIALDDADIGSGVEDSTILATPTTETDTGSGAESEALTVTLSDSDTGSGVEASTIAATLTDPDTGTGLDGSTIGVSSADTGAGTDAESIPPATLVDNEDVAFSETTSIAATLSATDIASADDFGITNQDNPAALGDYQVTLVQGPATVYVADYGSLEPGGPTSDIPVEYLDMGTTLAGVNLTVKQTYESPEIVQEVHKAGTRLKKRELIVETSLAEPSLTALLYALNHGELASGAGYTSYTPPMIDRATPLTYRTVIIDGWAPGFKPNDQHKRRRIILRRCLSTQGTETAYTKDKLTAFSVQWDVHLVDANTAPFKVIDEI